MFEITATTSPATESRHGNNSVRDTDEQFVTARGTTKRSSRCKSSYIQLSIRSALLSTVQAVFHS